MTQPNAFPDWALAPPAAQNQQQTLLFSGVAALGSFGLGVQATPTAPLVYTAPIAWNATAAQIADAVNLVYAPGGVTGSGSIASQSVVLDWGTGSQTNQPQLLIVPQSSTLQTNTALIVITPEISQQGILAATVTIDVTHQNNGFFLGENPPFNIFNQLFSLIGLWVRFFLRSINQIPKGENLFLNAGFEIAQRGLTGTIVAGAPKYTLDGWIVGCTTHNVAWSKYSLSGSNPRTALFINQSGGTPTDVKVTQRIESQVMDQVPDNTYVTVQLKLTNLTGASVTPTLTVNSPTAIDNFAAVNNYLATVNLQPCPTGQTTVLSYTFFVSGTLIHTGMEVIFDFGASLTNATAGYGLYLEAADISYTPNLTVQGLQSAPPLPKIRPIGVEMPNCLRYFQQFGGVSVGVFQGYSLSTTQFIYYLTYLVPMRTTPTLTTINVGNFTAGDVASGNNETITSFGLDGANSIGLILSGNVASGLTKGDVTVLITSGGGGFLQLSAEL